MVFPQPSTAMLTLAFHAEQAWRHRDAVRSTLSKGDNRCCRCSTRIPGWMEIEHADGDHFNWQPENLVPICHFCHLQAHPVQPLDDEDTLFLIWLPKISQNAVTALAWAMIWLLRAQTEAETAGIYQPGAMLNARSLSLLQSSLKGEIDALERAAGRVTGMARPDAMLNISQRHGEEPACWKGLRWWPGAASGRSVLKRWVPCKGLETISADVVGAYLFRQGQNPADMMERLTTAASRLATAAEAARSEPD